MAIVARIRNDRLWHLWNTEYLACGREAADEGFILNSGQGWEVHERGRSGGVRAIYPTLSEAMLATLGEVP